MTSLVKRFTDARFYKQCDLSCRLLLKPTISVIFGIGVSSVREAIAWHTRNFYQAAGQTAELIGVILNVTGLELTSTAFEYATV